MTEFQELIQDAPNFVSMERGELVSYAYGMFAAGTKANAENTKLRELVRGLHMAYVGALNKCESLDEGLIWEHCEMVDAELAKSHARFEADRHRFDVAMSELGIEVSK